MAGEGTMAIRAEGAEQCGDGTVADAVGEGSGEALRGETGNEAY